MNFRIFKNGKNNCPRNHKIGDEFIIEDGKTPEGLCYSAFHSIWPYARTLMLTKNKKFEGTVLCPDSNVMLEYSLELIE
ncbi:MAG: TIGR04076 family protein [Nanoarchaeota archaeon]